MVHARTQMLSPTHSFFPLFDRYVYSLVNTLPILQRATRDVLHAFAADSVVHLELRTGPRILDETSCEEDYLRAVLDEIMAFNAQQERARGNGGMRAFLILSIDRAKQSAESAGRLVEMAGRLREEEGYGQVLVGVELGGNPMKGDVGVFTDAFRRAAESGMGIAVHFAETERSSGKEELETLLAWNPRRLGHAVHVGEEMRKMVVERGIGLEICLSCNVMAGLVDGERGYERHPVREWVQAGARYMVFCTDDVGVFGSEASEEWALGMKVLEVGKEKMVRYCADSAEEVMFGPAEERERVVKLIRDFERVEEML